MAVIPLAGAPISFVPLLRPFYFPSRRSTMRSAYLGAAPNDFAQRAERRPPARHLWRPFVKDAVPEAGAPGGVEDTPQCGRPWERGLQSKSGWQ